MNIKFYDKEASDSFAKALQNCESVRNWLLNTMQGYIQEGKQSELFIGIDGRYDDSKEFQDFGWAISQYDVDNYGLIADVSNGVRRINGGLIYRGLQEVKTYNRYTDSIDKKESPYYTSHT